MQSRHQFDPLFRKNFRDKTLAQLQAVKANFDDSMLEKNIDLLKTFPQFSELDASELSHLAQLMLQQEMDTGHMILTQNEPADAVYFLEQGAVKILVNGEMVAKVETIQCFGEMSCLIPDTPASASVQISTKSKVLKIDKQRFLEAVNLIPKLWRSLFLQINSRFQAVNMRLSEVLAHSPEGLLRVDQKCVISNEYSIVCTDYFEKDDLTGIPFCELILEDPDQRPTWMETFSLLFDESTLPFVDIAALLTNERTLTRKDGTQKEFVFTYYPCRAIDGSVVAIDIGVEDVTEARELERTNTAMVLEQTMLGKIYENPESFIHLRAFFLETLNETGHLVEEFQHHSPAGLKDLMMDTMRKLHSLKSYAGIFAIHPIQKTTHILEGLVRDQEGKTEVTRKDLKKLRHGIVQLKNDYHFSESLFNRIGADLRRRLLGITLSQDQFKALKKASEVGDTVEIKRIVHNAEMVDSNKLVAHWMDESQRLSKSVGKKVQFSLEGNGDLLSKSMFNQLDEILIHLLRNSIDHGLETPEDRAPLGKPDVGRINVHMDHEDGVFRFRIEDDGRGIDFSKLPDKASGMKHLDQELVSSYIKAGEEWKILLLPGFSTAKELTDLSGQGVGLDAVATMVKGIGGCLTVESQLGAKTVVTLKVSLE